MKIQMSIPEYIDGVMVQELSIIDSTGITWVGAVKTKFIDNISINRLINIIKDAIVDARNGKDTVKIYREGYAKIKVELMNKNSYLNASSINITIHYNGEKIYSLYLEPTIR